MKNALIIVLIALAFVLFGCTQAPDNNNNNGSPPVCAQVITYAISPEGTCQEFSTACIPDGYAKVDNCPDSCAGIVCEDKCQATTLLSNGSCDNGECIYAETTPNSTECGYSAFDLQAEAILRYCNYNKYFKNYTFFLSVKNTVKSGPMQGSSVWLVSPEITEKIYQPINNSYDKGLYWWQDVFYASTGFKGQIFELSNRPEFKDFDYKFIYCELENNNTDSCTEQNGVVLYSGNTAADCNQAK